MSTIIIEVDAAQAQSAQMLALSIPLMLPELKQQAIARGGGDILNGVLAKLAAIGITEDALIYAIQQIATGEDVRLTVDGNLILRATHV